MKLLLDNRSRVLRLRLVLLGTAGLAMAGSLWAVDLWQHFGLAPADGGVLRPPGIRARVAIGSPVCCPMSRLRWNRHRTG